MKLVRRPVIRNERSRRLFGDEEQRLLDGCDAGKVAFFKTIIILAIETGMRRGEILGLNWSDISHNRRVISLTMTKSGSGREVPLSQRAFDALMDWKVLAATDAPKVFPIHKELRMLKRYTHLSADDLVARLG